MLYGCSVLSDVTDIINENRNLRFLNDTIPCGFIRYTCEKQPKVTYINEQMLKFLRIPKAAAGEADYLEMYKDNIFMMIPMEARSKFAIYLSRVRSAGIPLAGEINIQRFDGTKGRLFGWVTKFTNEHGKDEFQSVCIDVTESHQLRKADQTRRYIKALTDVYDRIFEYDLSNNTMKCLDSHNSALFKWLENIPMQIDEANEKWISSIVAEEDRNKVRSFFDAFRNKTLCSPKDAPPQISYREISSEGAAAPYIGTLIKINDSVSFYCCRKVTDDSEAEILRNENISLRENMQELVMRFNDGIAAFELTDGQVTPLYASDNVCEFFGFTKDEWLPLMKKPLLSVNLSPAAKLRTAIFLNFSGQEKPNLHTMISAQKGKGVSKPYVPLNHLKLLPVMCCCTIWMKPQILRQKAMATALWFLSGLSDILMCLSAASLLLSEARKQKSCLLCSLTGEADL